MTGTVATDWEVLDGPDSGVGVDFWYRRRGSGSEAHLNLDQDHLTISADDNKGYDGPRDGLAWV